MRMYSSILILKLINNVDIKSISQFPNMEQNNPKSFSAGFVTLQVVQLLPYLAWLRFLTLSLALLPSFAHFEGKTTDSWDAEFNAK